MSAPEKNYIAAIHAVQNKLGIRGEDAESLKIAVVGVGSSKDMTQAQRARYLAHLRGIEQLREEQAGKKVRERNAVQRSTADPHDDRWDKARALWTLLAGAGQVQVDTDAALLAYVRRQTHADSWRFLNGHQINTVVESLKRWCRRVGVEVDK